MPRTLTSDCIYQMTPKSEEQCHADSAWLQRALGRELCPDCKSIKSEWHPRELHVRLDHRPRRAATLGLWWTGVDIFRRDLIEILEPFLEGYVIGPCEDEEGDLIKNYVTCYTNRPIIIRGDKYCEYNYCESCGACWIGRTRNNFALKRDVVGRAVYQDRGGTLYLNHEAAALVQANVKGVRLWPISIIRRPLDGRRLPGDPDWSAAENVDSNPNDD